MIIADTSDFKNFAHGEVISAKQSEFLLETLQSDICSTLSGQKIDPMQVILACDYLVTSLNENQYTGIIQMLGIEQNLARHLLREIKRLYSKEALLKRMETELGADFNKMKTYVPVNGVVSVTEHIAPLGVLLHIPAGNADGLPVLTILEGLLAGNINILKLPSVDGGLTIMLISMLVQAQPALKDFIYVFDYSSKDVVNMQKLFDIADGVVVWGGDGAVASLRANVKPNTKIIEWGHKISFAYITQGGWNKEALKGIAHNIAVTDQLLCSSCQGLYLDTENPEDLHRLAKEFAEVLASEYEEINKQYEDGVVAQNTLNVYTQKLESIYTSDTIYTSGGVSAVVQADRALLPSKQFGNVWVKALPKAEILRTLRPYKNHLQTVGLLCAEGEKQEFCRIFEKTGVVRVCGGARMSETDSTAPHDGEYALRRYTKVFAVEDF